MKEYIEREAAIKAIERYGTTNGSVLGYHSGAVDCAIHAIEQLPAADVALARQGKWEWREEWETNPETHSCDLISCGWYCTGCGIKLEEYLTKATGRYVCLDDDSVKPKLNCCPNCCPNCGAKMGLKEGEDFDQDRQENS